MAIKLMMTAFSREDEKLAFSMIIPKHQEDAVRRAAKMPDGAVGEWQLPLDFFVGYVESK